MLSSFAHRLFNRNPHFTLRFTKTKPYSTTPPEKKHLVLIDGPPTVSKGFHSFRRRLYSLHNPPLPVSACFAYVKSILKIMNEWRYDYIAACWDTPGSTWRNQVYPQYVSRVDRMAEELKIQYPLSQRGTEALGIVNISVPGYESDDLIASVIAKSKQQHQDLEVTIFTPGQDCLQLVQDQVYLYHLSNKFQKFLDDKTVQSYYRVSSAQFSDYLALLAHRSQTLEIPHLKESSVVGLIEDFKSIPNLFENIEKVPMPLKLKFQESKDQILKQAQISKLKDDAPVPNLDSLRSNPIDKQKSDEYFKDLNFMSLIEFVSNHLLSTDATQSKKRDPASEKLQLENTLDQILNNDSGAGEKVEDIKPKRVRKKGLKEKEETK